MAAKYHLHSSWRSCNQPEQQKCEKAEVGQKNPHRYVHHQIKLWVVAAVGHIEGAVGDEALVQHVLVARHPHHLRLLLEVEVDGAAEVWGEVGYRRLVLKISVNSSLYSRCIPTAPGPEGRTLQHCLRACRRVEDRDSQGFPPRSSD